MQRGSAHVDEAGHGPRRTRRWLLLLAATAVLLGVLAPAAFAFPVTGTTITGVEGSPTGGPLATFTDLA